ncbi:PREDICTED: THAP domain-containing protein 2-like [Cyphomyrmex costatus]|uniref:THAP domain-containing protein 2-like n=1 Tax=Cyphomyrmex costatus TaxID=456900 RepID=UPI000852279A|nr:PREDICTED: THAP domain-containing protein 2-like [Cyphomyrmex costatus]
MYCYICKEKDQALTYHVFPKDPKLRTKWLAAFRFKEIDIMKYTRICGKHFEDTCFYYIDITQERKMLKKGSIPTLLLRKPKKRKLDLSKDTDDVKYTNIASTSEELQPQKDSSTCVFNPTNTCDPIVSVKEEIEEKVISGTESTCYSMESAIDMASTRQESQMKQQRWRPAHISQVDMEHGFDTPRRAKRHFNLAVSKVLLYQRKIIRINQQKRRILQKLNRLQSLLKELKDKDVISKEVLKIIQVFSGVKLTNCSTKNLRTTQLQNKLQ